MTNPLPLPPLPLPPIMPIVDQSVDRVRESMSNVKLYIGGAIVVCVITGVLVTIIAVIRPENTAMVNILVGVLTPVIMGLMAAGLQGIHRGVDGRLSQLLKSTAEASRMHGRAEVIRQSLFRLGTLDPKSPEYQTLADQIRADSMTYFQVVEKRL